MVLIRGYHASMDGQFKSKTPNVSPMVQPSLRPVRAPGPHLLNPTFLWLMLEVEIA
jgi:hypothetical protein